VGKRIAIGLDGALWPLLHLMIASRLHWKPAHAALSGRRNLAAFDFPPGSLTLTEAGSKRRAPLHVVASPACSPCTREASMFSRPTRPASAPR
jgi:formamidopyrimidine-DNA glycosylase